MAEALASKKPVLITNKVNIYRDIKKYKSGFISNDDYEGVILSLKKIMNLKKNDYREMSYNAYQCYKDNFNSINTSKKLINFIKRG